MFNQNDSKTPTGNNNLEQSDLQLVLAFTNAYEELHAKGEITDQQFYQILDIIDNYKRYTESEVKAKLAEIFPEKL